LPTSGSAGRPDILVDTSAAIALVVADHEGHDATVAAVHGRTLGLAGHAWFETYSVLTRLPSGMRRSPAETYRVLSVSFPGTRHLDRSAAEELAGRLAEHSIADGSVYDALVGAAAALHELPLMSRDRRALRVYEALGVKVELVA
jgi:predicted nucleic acid-binding protein